MMDAVLNAQMEQTRLTIGAQNPSLDKVKNKEEIEKTAEDFEAFFITQMLEQMHEGIETEGMFGGGHAEKVYRSMLFGEYGKSMAKSGGIGVSDMIARDLVQLQERMQ